MFDEKKLSDLLGKSDEKFQENFDNSLLKARAGVLPVRRLKRRRLKIFTVIAAVCLMLTGAAFAAAQIFVERADGRGFALYNEAGEELEEIRYLTVGYSEPLSISTRTKTEKAEMREAELKGTNGIKITSDYEEAAMLLGAEFRLPGIYNEGFDPPEYKMQNIGARKALYVTISGEPGFYYFAEQSRSESSVPEEWYAPGAVIEECKIAGVTVYKATDEFSSRYTWAHDGLVYMLFQFFYPGEFTDGQFVEIIESMIR